MDSSKILLVAALAFATPWGHAAAVHKAVTAPRKTVPERPHALAPSKIKPHLAATKAAASRGHEPRTRRTASVRTDPPTDRHRRGVAASLRVEDARRHTKHEVLIARTQQHPAIKVSAAHQGRAVVSAREAVRPIVEAPEPQTLKQPDAEALRARHNRKEHFAAQPGAEAHMETPRNAASVALLSSADAPLQLGATPSGQAEESATAHVKADQPLPDPPALTPRQAKKEAAVIHKAEKDARPVEAKPVAEVAFVPPVPMPALYTKRGKLIVPPALKGSHEILVRQNVMADHDGLDRIQDDDDLDDMRLSKLLVAIPSGPGIQTDERLPANRRYCRPWTARFLDALAKAHYAKFHTPLQVNSAVRTVEFQQHLLRTNGNAAPAEGDTASPHLTGQAVDLAKHGLSMTEIAWLRGYLLPLVQQGKVDVEEEFQQACFHISVYRKYVPQPAAPRTITARRGSVTALAAAMR